MKFNLLACGLALASTVVAGPLQARGYPGCLSKDTATTLVNRYIGVLSHNGSDLGNANTTAQAILDDNYEEVSDSILSLEGQPVSTPPVLSSTLALTFHSSVVSRSKANSCTLMAFWARRLWRVSIPLQSMSPIAPQFCGSGTSQVSERAHMKSKDSTSSPSTPLDRLQRRRWSLTALLGVSTLDTRLCSQHLHNHILNSICER